MRLIDADALRENILHDNTFDNDTVNYYLAMVDGMETAFDMDIIAERLEEGINGVLYDRCHEHDYIFGMDEIKRLIRKYVKGGGQGV